MNSIRLKSELATFFQTLPPKNIDLDVNYVNNFSNLFIRYIAEIPGEGILYPSLNRALLVSLNSPIKDLFKQNMAGIATSLISSKEYSTKVGSSLDGIISLLPNVFQLTPGDVPIVASFSLSADLSQFLDPIFLNPGATSFDLASNIVEGFLIKLRASSVINTNTGITLNWIVN